MYIDDYDFTHQDVTLLRDMPEEIICLDCQEPYVTIIFREHTTTETLRKTYQLDYDDSCTIPIYDLLVDYFEHYQTDRFEGSMLIMEGDTQAAYWQVDIIDSILSIENAPGQVCYTSDFADALVINSNAASVTVEVSDESGHVLHTSTYYPYADRIEFPDFASLIENYMLQKTMCCGRFSIKMTEPLASITHKIFLIYSSKRVNDITAQNFYKQSFLTTYTSRQTTPDAFELLPLIVNHLPGTKKIIVEVIGTYLLPDGTLARAMDQTQYTYSSYFSSLTVSPYSIDKQLKTANPSISGRLVMYTIQVENRRCTYFITDAQVTRTFLFRNAFNCLETLNIFTSTTKKLESSFSTAVCGDRLTHYNVEHTQSFEEQTSSLLLQQTDWLQEFLTSPHIQLHRSTNTSSGNTEVLIKSYTFEPSNAPGDSANTLKFEWQFSSRRGYHALNHSTRIFTEQFTSHFA